MTPAAPGRDITDKFEQLFGSEQTIGVVYELHYKDGRVEHLSASEMEAMDSLHRSKEEWDELLIDTQSTLPDGSSATCCTNHARHIRRVLSEQGHKVVLLGFANEDNLTARCVIERFHPGGHDFALVDDRYLVDPWVRIFANEPQIVYDLRDATDMAKAVELYGPREYWLPLESLDTSIPGMPG